MAKKKDKKNPALKQIDIATYGVTKPNTTSGSKGTSSTSHVGGYADWSQVDDAKTVMTDLLGDIEKSKNTRDTTRLRNQCKRDGGMWDPKTGTCIKDEETSTNNNGEPTDNNEELTNNNVETTNNDGELTEEDCEFGLNNETGECNPNPEDKDSNDEIAIEEEPSDENGDPTKSGDNAKDSNLGQSEIDSRNAYNANFGEEPTSRQDRRALEGQQRKWKNNLNPSIEGIKDRNSYYSIQLGGGDFESMNIRSKFNKKGVFDGYVSKGKDSKGNKWDYGFKIQKGKGGLRTIKFNKMDGKTKRVFKEFGLSTRDSLSKEQWKSFRTQYKAKLESAQKQLEQARKDGKKEDALAKEVGPIEKLILQLHARGFFTGDFGSEDTPVEFRSPVKHGTTEDFQYGRNGHNPDIMEGKHEDWHTNKIEAEKKGEEFNKPAPNKFRSPFPRRNRGYLNRRKDWLPNEQSPINYGSPLHQEEKQSVKGQQFGSIWEKIKAYGPDMPEKIDKFVQHVSYNPETDKPIHALQNQEWVGAITKWLQGQKAAIVKARNNKNQDEQQKIVASVNTLIQDVITYSGKFMAWKDRNSGNQEEGSAGGSVVSEGSRKDERFIGNTTFMGDVNTTMAVGADGKLGIKAFGLPEVRYVEELDNQVFAKDDVGLLQFTRISEELQKSAQSGQPLNENVVKGNADQLLKSKDSILSWAFDPLYGQSWLQDYVQANPDADVDMFMPESSTFDIDYLADELHGWLTSKLKESYDKNVPQQPAQKGDAAQSIMNETLANVEEEKKNKQGVYAEGGEQPQQQVMAQGPPQQSSPMTYKTYNSERAIKLLRKYSK